MTRDHDHRSDHDHEYPHEHPHPGHSHPHGSAAPHGDSGHERRLLEGDPEAHRVPLTEGCGAGKILFFDAPTGLAGDMLIASLVDLGVPSSVVVRAVSALGLQGVEPRVERAMAGAIGAAAFSVRVHERQPHRHYADIDALIERSSLAGAVKSLARGIFSRLAHAEAQVHRVPVEQVHFHEVGAADAIVDIVGAAACLRFLGAEVVCSPLPMGGGTVECEHGTLPLPAPATLLCLQGVPTYDAGQVGELVTPTGAAIVATASARFERWPNCAPLACGWGAGSRALPGRVNALRAVLALPAAVEGAAATSLSHVVVEANLDDMSGELAGHAIELLIASGALDAWVVPTTMKKGRPGLLISALCVSEQQSVVADVLLRETHTIGVRAYEVSRTERPRQVVEVATPFGNVSVKISGGGFGPDRIKPEFDECVALARKAGVPVREVLEAALVSARSR